MLLQHWMRSMDSQPQLKATQQERTGKTGQENPGSKSALMLINPPGGWSLHPGLWVASLLCSPRRSTAHCQPCLDLGSCSRSVHASHSTGHKYAFHIRKETIPYVPSLRGHPQTQGQTAGQKLFMFPQTLFLPRSIKFFFSLDLLDAVFKNKI